MPSHPKLRIKSEHHRKCKSGIAKPPNERPNVLSRRCDTQANCAELVVYGITYVRYHIQKQESCLLQERYMACSETVFLGLTVTLRSLARFRRLHRRSFSA